MSTVLRALKRLEKDAAVDADTMRLPGKSKFEKRRDRYRRVFYGIGFAGVLCAVGLVGIAVFYRSVWPPAGLKPPRHAANMSQGAADAQKEAATAANIAGKSMQPSSSGVPVINKELKGVPLRLNSDEPAGASLPRHENAGAPPQSDHSEDLPGADKSESPEPAIKAGREEVSPAINKRAPSAAAYADAKATETIIFEDIGLQIQAISWNENPSQRIAVINSRLCREGETVNGYRILAINPDDIEVSNGQKSGKLIFKLH